MTKLEAVNRVLRAISEPPATALDTGGTSDVADAETFLDDSTNTILGERRWWAITVKDTLSPNDTTHKISMSGVLQFDLSDASVGLDLSVRSEYLYDLENDTDQFTQDVELWLTKSIDFANLPSQLQEYVVAHARLLFAGYKKRGQQDAVVLSNELTSARVRAFQDDNDHNKRMNVLDTVSVINIKGRRQKYVY